MSETLHPMAIGCGLGLAPVAIIGSTAHVLLVVGRCMPGLRFVVHASCGLIRRHRAQRGALTPGR